jgi:hypothetical protein
VILIGLCGAAGSGKSTFAKQLVDEWDFIELSFALSLKLLAVEQFGYDMDRLSELAYKEEQDPNLPDGWTRRRVLQHLGTEGFRAIDPDFWVRKVEKQIEGIKVRLETLPGVVISDVRYENEAKMIREQGGYLVRLDRPGFEGTASNGHASEQEWRDLDVDLRFAPPDRDGVVCAANITMYAITEGGLHHRDGQIGGPETPQERFEKILIDVERYCGITDVMLGSDPITRKHNLNDRRIGPAERRVYDPLFFCPKALDRRWATADRRQS